MIVWDAVRILIELASFVAWLLLPHAAAAVANRRNRNPFAWLAVGLALPLPTVILPRLFGPLPLIATPFGSLPVATPLAAALLWAGTRVDASLAVLLAATLLRASCPSCGARVSRRDLSRGRCPHCGATTERGDLVGRAWRVYTGKVFRPVLTYGVLVLSSILTLAPLVWLVACAFKGPEDFFSFTFFPPPQRLTGYNFRQLFGQVDFLRLMMNSFFVTGAVVMIQLFFSSLGGFALAKYEFRGKKIIMIVMLATMMIPAQVLLAPMYELVCRLRLADTHLGLIVPGAVSVFGMFLFRQSMMQIPDELLQAGRIDGCSEFGLYWNIALPVSRPMIGAFCLVAFMGNWNSFLWPAIILQSKERFTLPIGLTQLVGLQQQEYGALMAGTLLAVLPVAVLFFALQKEFIRGLTAGAVKG